MTELPSSPPDRLREAAGWASRWLRGRRQPARPRVAATIRPAVAADSPSPESVIILTTWNRPELLRQSLPQIEREAASIGAALVIADDQSDDAETLALLAGAAGRGADVIRRDYVRTREPDIDVYLHRSPDIAHAHLHHVSDDHARMANGSPPEAMRDLLTRWEQAIQVAHVYTQLNNLFAFRHVLAVYPTAAWIVKVDDDVALCAGAFARMRETWQRAQDAGLDVLSVSGIRTVNELVVRQYDGYAVTHGACNVAILYRTADWAAMLAQIPESLIVRDGFDLAFVWQYAPTYRTNAVPVCLTPSVVYHTGFNGVHVRNVDLNRDFVGSLEDIVVL